MHSKKAIKFSLYQILGLLTAALVLIIVIVIIGKAYNLVVDKPDYSTDAGFTRIADTIGMLREGESAYIPIQIGGNFKVTVNSWDPACLENCICLCKINTNQGKGCLLKIYREQCYTNKINFPQGEFSNFDPTRSLPVGDLQVSKDKNGVIQVGGQYQGACLASGDYDKCVNQLNNCAFTFLAVGTGLQFSQPTQDLQSSLSCLECSDGFITGDGTVDDFRNVGTGFTRNQNIGCQRYSYYAKFYRANLGVGEERVTASLSVPLDYNSGLLAGNLKTDAVKNQCLHNNCGDLKSKGATCYWKEDAAANTGTCDDCGNLDCSTLLEPDCSTTCGGKCQWDKAKSVCKQK